MKNITNKKANLILTAFFATCLTAILSHAEPYKAQDGLEKVKTNVETAKSNEEDYKKNLAVINDNMSAIGKSKAQVNKQKDTVNAELNRNNESLKKVSLKEKELQQLITAEEQKRNEETKQLEKLAKLQEKIQENQRQRDILIADYKKQLGLVAEEKTVWKNRETELKTEANKAAEALRGLASQESNWNSKKKSYEGEVKKWSAEVGKQQKSVDTYESLKNTNK